MDLPFCLFPYDHKHSQRTKSTKIIYYITSVYRGQQAREGKSGHHTGLAAKMGIVQNTLSHGDIYKSFCIYVVFGVVGPLNDSFKITGNFPSVSNLQ